MAKGSVLPHQGDRKLEAMADAIRDGQRGNRGDSSDGRYVRDVVVEAGSEKRVFHGLRRRPKGWRPESVRASSSCEYPVETSRDAELLVLHNYGAADVTLDVWVF